MHFEKFSSDALAVFDRVIVYYHIKDDINQKEVNDYKINDVRHLLHKKCWIDTVQWHLEDIIRIPSISDKRGMKIKRLIDASNQKRTDTVEAIDQWFLSYFKDLTPLKSAILNTESPAWAIDRLSILSLRIYHMEEETKREQATLEHQLRCKKKLEVLLHQRDELSTAIDQLLFSIRKGEVLFRPFRQMKMYNDKSLNPALYSKS